MDAILVNGRELLRVAMTVNINRYDALNRYERMNETQFFFLLHSSSLCINSNGEVCISVVDAIGDEIFSKIHRPQATELRSVCIRYDTLRRQTTIQRTEKKIIWNSIE